MGQLAAAFKCWKIRTDLQGTDLQHLFTDFLKMTAQKIRWGVLGVAKIAVEKVIPAMQRGQQTEVIAIASRSLEKAREAAARLGLPKFYGSYDELLADPDIDAIYNPLPNHLHVPWSIKSLRAGKHVLCEKPI